LSIISKAIIKKLQELIQEIKYTKKKKHEDTKQSQKADASTGTASVGTAEPEKEPDDKFIKKLREKINDEYLKKYENFLKKDSSGRYRCEKAESPIWAELEPYKDEFRTNGLSEQIEGIIDEMGKEIAST